MYYNIIYIVLNPNLKWDIPGLKRTSAFRHAYSVESTLMAVKRLMTSCSERSCDVIRSACWSDILSVPANKAPEEMFKENKALSTVHENVR